MPLNHILRKCTAGSKLNKSQEKINHLMYMDDIKLFSKNEKELETQIHAVRVYSQDIGMELSIEKCAMLVMKTANRHLTVGMQLPNQDKKRTVGEKEILGHLGGWHDQTSGNERKIKSESQENQKATRDKTM